MSLVLWVAVSKSDIPDIPEPGWLYTGPVYRRLCIRHSAEVGHLPYYSTTWPHARLF